MQQKRTFYGVQILRGLAAGLVVLFHVSGNLHDNNYFVSVPVFYFGNGGVDLFFLISGFVIYSTTVGEWDVRGAWAKFLSRRFTRIIPLYWLMTSLKLAALLIAPGLLQNPELGGWQTAASYLFIPAWNSTHSALAIIVSGWTLCFEMFFYYVCALCLALGFRPLTVITPFFALLALVGIFRTNAWGAPAVLLDPLLLEFVAGMWIGHLATTKHAAFRTVTVYMLLAAGVLALIASGLLAPHRAYEVRVLVWGIPAAAILVAVVSLESSVNFRRMRLPLLLGNASYAIYLTELSVQPMIARLRHFNLDVVGEYGSLAAFVVIALSIGVVVYYCVEQPLLKGIRAAIRPSKAGMVVSSQPRV